MSAKIIVTNLSALKTKYGTGFAKIQTAINALIAADQARSLQTRVIDLGSAAAMKKVKGKGVSDAASPKQNKDAIDAIYRALVPEYLVLLGATDIIPHVDLRNPVFGAEDPDEFAFGDLPYACESPYSQKVQDFVGPTRVVGRLPDVTGANDPAYLVGLLDVAGKWSSRPVSDYTAHLGMSAEVWKGSTALSLQKLFGSSSKLQLVPPRGYKWAPGLLSTRSHFINCHGAPADVQYYGQRKSNYPVAHSAVYVKGRIKEGTVAAAECCYGAELYNPALRTDNQMGIANAYLAGKAYGFFGSTTIAYGPATGNGSADLVCQYFLKRVIAGASIGRAALEARQEFAQGAPQLDPVDLKTLAQFNLLGDPSITPVTVPTPHIAMAGAKAFRGAGAEAASREVARMERRRQLFAKGLSIAETQVVARRAPKAKPARSVETALKSLAAGMRIGRPKILSYTVERATAKTPLAKRFFSPMAKMPAATAFHVVIGKAEASPLPVPQIAAVVAKEQDGKIVSFRQLRSR